jgi:hypothetical protein
MAQQALEKVLKENPEADPDELFDLYLDVTSQWEGAKREAYLQEVFDTAYEELVDEGRRPRALTDGAGSGPDGPRSR